jgi:hypothetical protein
MSLVDIDQNEGELLKRDELLILCDRYGVGLQTPTGKKLPIVKLSKKRNCLWNQIPDFSYGCMRNVKLMTDTPELC